MKNSNKVFLFTLLVVSIVCYNSVAFCQGSSLSGTWAIGSRTILTGPDYADAIPKQMQIVIDGNTIITTKTITGIKNDTVVIQKLKIGGPKTVSSTNSGNVKSEMAKWLIKDHSLVIETITSKQNSPTLIEFKIDDTLEICDTGKLLKLTRNSRAINADKKYNYVVNGEYDLIDSGKINAGIGIRFKENLSWTEILSMAKKENKFIFIDCYATWCGPCKLMDNNVYPTYRVGNFANEHFVSIRLQMDSTLHDSQKVKDMYRLVNKIQSEYKVNAFPTYLFFGPEGEIVHRAIGYVDPLPFINVLKDAVDSNKQYYKLLGKFKNGESLPSTSLKFLAEINFQNGDRAQANAIAETYIENYLNKLDDQRFLTQENFDFLNEFSSLQKTTDKFFQLCYNKPILVDSTLHNPGLANFIVSSVVLNKVVYAKALKNGDFSMPITLNPYWVAYTDSIKLKFPKINADSLILTCKIAWYSRVPKCLNWNEAINNLVEYIDKYGMKALGFVAANQINDIITMHCNSTLILKKALRWEDEWLSRPNLPKENKKGDYANYAGLLYKLGRRAEALKYLNDLLSDYDSTNSKEERLADPSYQGYIKIHERMNRGEKLDASWGANNFH